MNTYALIPLETAPEPLPKSDTAPWYVTRAGVSYLGLEWSSKSSLPDLKGWEVLRGAEEYQNWANSI